MEFYRTVHADGEVTGTIRLYQNPFHRQNQYLELRLDRYDSSISAELFRDLYMDVGCPLQIMLPSNDHEQIRFITSGGFVCRRKCYEVEAGKDDYIGGDGTKNIFRTDKGQPEYTRCCELMYLHYVRTHRETSPLTAEPAVFWETLPETALYQEKNGAVLHGAFIEGNEIAYICTCDEDSFPQFAEAVVNILFAEYSGICFEADDTDPAAMALYALFSNQSGESFDTYIFDPDGR